MALATDFLEDVSPKKLDWCFNVYLIRFWEEPDKNNEEKINSIDMVIQDIKGTRVQGSIPDSLFKEWMGKLEEFKIYAMINFIVADTRPRTCVATCKWILTFCKKTTIKCVEVRFFELRPFIMKAIPELYVFKKRVCNMHIELFDD
ncbi:hypothetical protein PIB30_016102 [Stylosanthes scabra]|uniref:Replication protein A 70 kDa DNA-binding subunit B/D first OB fold domain-containing protein n=1 Tax=Stylosanthes scabra TaxID=79078 RepID=A0ABU6Q876_9FABA|nr:hypothetical protein [Stylosanthes scabra]